MQLGGLGDLFELLADGRLDHARQFCRDLLGKRRERVRDLLDHKLW